jgi:hypothetical protein
MPNKRRPDVPHFAHATGRWAKRIWGKLHYCGSWSGTDCALTKYQELNDALHADRMPREAPDGVAIKELRDRVANIQHAPVESGEPTNRPWQDYKDAGDLIAIHFGKDCLVADLSSDDFAILRAKLSKMSGPVTLGNVIQRVQVVVKVASDNDPIDRTEGTGRRSSDRPARSYV